MNDVALLLACLAVMVIPVAIHCRILARAAARRIPAAPDNQPGTDTRLLATCQHIHRQTRKEDTL